MISIQSSTDRHMARFAIFVLSLGAMYGVYSFGMPVYWRFYANVIKPFEDSAIEPLSDDPFTAALLQKQGQGHVQKQKQTTPVKKMFNPDDYILTKEKVLGSLQDGYIMVTWANEHYIDFARSWVYNVKKAGIHGYLVGAMDDDMLRRLHDLNINTWRMNTNITKNDLGWGSPNFHKMGRSKITLIQQFLQFDVKVVISDIDTAWTRNPLPFFAKYPDADILTSSDQLHETVNDESLERYPEAASSFNIGIMLFSPKSKAFVDEWVKKLEDPKMWDQSAFNDLVRIGAGNSEPPHNLFKGYKGTLTVGILPVALFASGHMFFVQKKYEALGLQPYVAHATFQYSGTPGKRHRFREALLWDDPPEYFDHPKGFIHMKMDIPQAMLDNATGIVGDMTPDKMHRHFDLVNFQLLRIRAGLALAKLTGRVLILPPIICELDKYWAPLYDGNIPGSKWKKPYICPLDHVFDLEGGWLPERSKEEYGPQIEFREYSFLDNARLPAKIKDSRVVVEVCKTAAGGCGKGDAAASVTGKRVKLAPKLDSAKLDAALQSAASYKLWEVENIIDMWPTFTEKSGWFTDPVEHGRFVNRIKMVPSVICCLNTNPGWIWYDLLWDVPHTDRHNRKYESWHFKRGEQDVKAARALLGADDVSWKSEQAGLAAGPRRKLLALPRRQDQQLDTSDEQWLADIGQQAMFSWP